MSTLNFWYRFFCVGSKYISQGGHRFILTTDLTGFILLYFLKFLASSHVRIPDHRIIFWITHKQTHHLYPNLRIVIHSLLSGIILFQTFIQKYFIGHLIFEIFFVLKWGLFLQTYPVLCPIHLLFQTQYKHLTLCLDSNSNLKS